MISNSGRVVGTVLVDDDERRRMAEILCLKAAEIVWRKAMRTKFLRKKLSLDCKESDMSHTMC